jgi:hypothetical protein
VSITVAGSLFVARFRFSPPVIEVDIPSNIQPLNHYRIAQGLSVIRRGGTFVSTRVPSDLELAAAGVHGTDYFLGGRDYEVTEAVAAELQAAGYTIN